MNTITPSTIEKARWVRFTYLYERAYFLATLQATIGPVTLDLPSRGILQTWDGMVNGRVDPSRSIWFRVVALANSHGADPVRMVRALFYHLEEFEPPLPCALLNPEVLQWESTYLEERIAELGLELELHVGYFRSAINLHQHVNPAMPPERVRSEVIASTMLEVSPLLRWMHADHAKMRSLKRDFRRRAILYYIRDMEACDAVYGPELPVAFQEGARRFRAKLCDWHCGG